MADPQDLYVTIIQTSGVIVGVTGGFLTASVVNIAAKRRDLEERIAEYQVDIDQVRQQREQNATALAVHDQEDSHQLPPISAVRARKRLVRTTVEADTHIAEIESHIRSLRDQLDHVGKPPTNLGQGLASLAFLSLTGIIMPLLFIPQDPQDYCWWYKLITVGAFTLGLTTVFGYLAELLYPGLLTRLRSWRP